MPAPFRTIEISDPTYVEPGLSFVTVKSAALKRRADLTLFVPPGHEGEILPRVILLHGVYGSHWAWALKGGAHRVLGQLMESGQCPPMALAMPSDGLWGDGSGYLTHLEADYAQWIVDEVPAALSAAVPSLQAGPLFISGLSMGGYGALRLGALHSDRFAGISAHSSITDYRQMQGFVEEPLAAFRLPEGQITVVAEAILRNKSSLPPLRFDCGLEDTLLPYNRELHQRLEAEGVAHSYEEFPGAHSWEYWHEHLADTLRFFAGCLKG